jgi:methylamine dehydrogenase accessory protein MauD
VTLHGWWAASYLALWILVVTLCVVVVALARQIGTLHLRLGPRGALEMDDEGPPLGEGVVPIEATDLEGRSVALAGSGAAQLILFVSPGCQVCETVLPSIAAVAGAAGLAPYVVTDLDSTETALSFAHKRLNAPVVPSPEAARAYSIPGTPYVVVLDELGVVRAKGTVNSLEQMEGLIDTGKRRSEEASKGNVQIDA